MASTGPEYLGCSEKYHRQCPERIVNQAVSVLVNLSKAFDSCDH